ncbi:MAG TPA: hypothetical protein VEC06_02545 [Paucimonas sp.]|nr:hypothetical protein [Paucimonas sp.]
MEAPFIHLAEIKLAPGVSEAELLAASDAFERNFVSKQEGVLRRILLKGPGGSYADLVFYRSREDADRLMQNEEANLHCQSYFSVMQLPEDDPEAGVTSFETLRTYG